MWAAKDRKKSNGRFFIILIRFGKTGIEVGMSVEK